MNQFIAPDEYLLNVPLRYHKNFAIDFNCLNNSYMNPNTLMKPELNENNELVFRSVQKAMELIVMRSQGMDKIRATLIDDISKLTDVIELGRRLKYYQAAHIARMKTGLLNGTL